MTDGLRTDYERLSARYDEDREKWDFAPDEAIAELSGDATVRVLDIGCGTGKYLAAQRRHFPSASLELVGVDPSAGMLQHARTKVVPPLLAQGRSEHLPITASSVDLVVSTFCFHHFTDKQAALREMVRVLVPGGRIRITNVEPWSMDEWWPYTFFDGTREIDEQRFWRPERIAAALTDLGATTDVQIDRSDAQIPVTQVLADAERRVVSQIAVLDDERYAAGLARLRELAKDDDGTVRNATGTLTLTARLL